MSVVDDNSISNLPIPDLERRKFYDNGNVSYVRVTDPNNIINGIIDEGNSSSTPLGIGGNFVGDPFHILPYSIIYITVFSDQASATDGLLIEQGHLNGAYKWDSDDKYTIPANSGKTFSIQAANEYMRVSYTNGSVAQTEFRLNVVCKKSNGLASSHRIQDPIIDDDDATLHKSVLTAKRDDDNFVNIGATNSNNLRVTDAESGLAIAKGDVSGHTFIHKFGNAPSFATGDGIVSIWDAADGSGSAQYQYNYSSTADIDSISSSNSGDTQDIEVQGLDTDYVLTTQTVTLTGQTTTTLTTPLIRVFRMKNIGSTILAGNVFLYINGSSVTNGVPNNPANIRAGIEVPNNQTLMAIYTIPANKTGYLEDWYAATAAGNKNATYKLILKARSFGGVFQTKHVSSISDIGTNAYQHKYKQPEIFLEKTDIEMTVELLSTGVAGASISAGFDIVLVDH